VCRQQGRPRKLLCSAEPLKKHKEQYHLWRTEIFKMDKNFQLFNQNKEFKNPEIQEIMGRMLYELSHAA